MDIVSDFRIALRGFRRSPAFVVTALAILGIGIGMSVAMFTVFRTVLVRRLPVVDQDRIVVMWTYRSDPAVEVTLGTKELDVVRRESRTMRNLAGVAHWPATAGPFLDGDRTVGLNRGMVTGNFFEVVGARPALGRLLRPSDDESATTQATDSTMFRALVISYGAWQQKFGGDSAVIGRHLIEPLLRTHYTIVGVAPPGFDYPAGAEYWIPMWQGWSSTVSAFAVARLAPGATVAAARNEYVAIERRVTPAMHFGGAHAATFTDTVLGNARPVLALLAAAVGLLLLIACLNVGNLLLLRASSRAREIAIRRALGAGYAQIVRQLIVEAAALAVAGGLLGLGVSIALLRGLVAFAPVGLPRIDDLQLSGTPVLLAIAVSSLAVLVFGIAPALITAGADLASPLRLDSRSGSETRRRRTVRQALVASQVALAMIMLGGAALLARSLEHLERQDAGYVSDHLSVFYYTWNARRFDSASKMVDLAARATTRLEAIPGVIAATPLVVPPMLGNSIWQVRFDFEGQTPTEAASNPAVPVEMPGPDFFKTFGIAVVQGRAFDENDRATSPLVAMVSQSAARKLWPGQNPIGKKIRLRGATPDGIVGGSGWRTVVGVAHDANLRTIREAAAMVYLPSRQGYWQGSIAIRSTVALSALTPALKAAGHDVDSDLELWDPKTMDDVLSKPLAEPRLGTLMMSSFGFVALLLAAIGLYGVMASLVRDQTRDIGIRIALGATSSRVRGEVLRRAGIVVGIGAAVGLVAAFATSRLLTTLLFQVSPTDPIALGGACVVLLAVGTLAAYVPARRATRIDPVQALRAD